MTFPAVALAELGDKTQLVVIYLAARLRKPWAVLAGLVAGALVNAGLAVAGGALLDRFVPARTLDWIVAAGFLAIGAWILLERGGEPHESTAPSTARGAFLATFWLFVVMEMGDKTQLATVALAAGLPSAHWVFFGAALGLAAANLPAIWLGHRFASRIPHTALRWISGTLFVLIGLGLLGYRLL